jgi:hypothetical protein
MDPLLVVEIYGGALVLGIVVFCTAKAVSRSFDRKHPHLTRQGMRASAKQAEVRRNASPLGRRAVMVPSYPAMADLPAREKDLEQSLDHLGRNVAREMDRKRREANAA